MGVGYGKVSVGAVRMGSEGRGKEAGASREGVYIFASRVGCQGRRGMSSVWFPGGGATVYRAGKCEAWCE